MYVYLAKVSGWDGSSIVGIFKTEEGALRASIEYLLIESISLDKEDVHTPQNKRIEEWGSVWEISNSQDILTIRKEEVK